MSFEKIGPYGLNRRDHLAASLVISFLIGTRSIRIKMALFVAGCVIGIIGGIVTDNWVIIGGAAGALLGNFVICPAFRSQKAKNNVYLSYDADGLVAENNNIKTLYKWATVRCYRKIGSRLFVAIGDAVALVIADRLTDPANMRNIISTLDGHRTDAPL